MKKPVKIEPLMFLNAKKGETFLSFLADNNLAGKASYYKRKIKTSRCILVETDGLKNVSATPITKITFLD